MSNLLFNIRFGTYFFQVTRDWDVSWEQSLPHKHTYRHEPGWKWFEIYTVFGIIVY